MTATSKRPVFLNVWQIRLPVAGVLSIAHRVSGVLLILSLPIMVHLFELSLAGPESFAQVVSLLSHPFSQLLLLLLTWSLLHHLFAGIRYLFIDLDLGLERSSARNSAWVALVGALVVTPLIWGQLP
jgi:succinate dehydrogenase / fumarate reductase cytochrome b subunit